MRNSCSFRLLKGFISTIKQRNLTQTPKSMATSFQAVLDQHTTSKYFIEYNGFLSNHLSHGLIALHRLGCPVERLNRFIQWYITRLESPSISDESEADDINKLKGKRSSYYTILKHYQNLYEQYGKKLDVLIGAEFPKLSTGLAGSALHGMIHLGYGYSVKNERVILEGLAYLHHSNMPIKSSVQGSFGHGDTEILAILSDIARDEELRKTMLDGMDKDEYTGLGVGGFQRRVACLLSEQGDKLVSKLLTVKIPLELFNPDGTINIHLLAKTVLKWAITVYTISEAKNDFFLLHGVTAAWSLRQIISLLKYDDALNAIQHYLTVLLAVYIAQNSPALTIPRIKDKVATPEEWAKLIKRTVDADRDEHCYKLVQVCYEMAKEDMDDASLYLQASESAITNEFVY